MDTLRVEKLQQSLLCRGLFLAGGNGQGHFVTTRKICDERQRRLSAGDAWNLVTFSTWNPGAFDIGHEYCIWERLAYGAVSLLFPAV